MTTDMNRATRVDKWDERKRAYLREVARRGMALTLDDRRGARWAKGPRGVVAILGASEAPSGDRWFLGLNEVQFEERNAIGLILLCEQGDKLLDFALAADRLRAVMGRLSRVGGERKINLVRTRDRYVIQVPGSEGVDVTATLGALGSGGFSTGTPANRRDTASTTDAADRRRQLRFVARVHRGRLQPLDPIELEEGEVLLVQTERMEAAPGHASLRHIVALGGPPDLPADLAAQHDHYAHGAPRR